MRFKSGGLPGLVLVELEPRRDDRGFFVEDYRAQDFARAGIAPAFVQNNRSRSVRGTLRGLHSQLRRPQGKLIRVTDGEIFDVVVDGRAGTPGFGKWQGFPLRAADFTVLYIPPGFFHGFCVMSEEAEVEYQCTDYYDPADEVGVLWNDPELGIRWPLEDPLLSAKDRALPPFSKLRALLGSGLK